MKMNVRHVIESTANEINKNEREKERERISTADGGDHHREAGRAILRGLLSDTSGGDATPDPLPPCHIDSISASPRSLSVSILARRTHK